MINWSSFVQRGKSRTTMCERGLLATNFALLSHTKFLTATEKVQSEKTVAGGSTKVEICSIQNSPSELLQSVF